MAYAAAASRDLDGRRGAQEGEDGAVVIRVRVDVYEPDPRA
jgi:hypothetical protein